MNAELDHDIPEELIFAGVRAVELEIDPADPLAFAGSVVAAVYNAMASARTFHRRSSIASDPGHADA